MDEALKDPKIRQYIVEKIREDKENAETARSLAWYFFFMFGLLLVICAFLGFALLLRHWNML